MAYVRLLPDSDSSELQKVLEMKALRRQEQTSIIQLYKSRAEGQATTVDPCWFCCLFCCYWIPKEKIF